MRETMKIAFMNYYPYEYELLEKKLEQLGKNGYFAKNLSFLTFLKKEKQPIFYQIVFYHAQGEKKRERHIQESMFIQQYLQKGFYCLYAKHHMFVFAHRQIQHKESSEALKEDIVSVSFIIRSAFIGLLALLGSVFFIHFILTASFDQFLSYGMSFVYAGLASLLAIIAYRQGTHTIEMLSFYQKIKKQEPHFSLRKLKMLRYIYYFILTISILCIGGGFIENSLNVKTFTPQEHHMLTLSDFHIQKETTLSTQAYSSFTLPHSYISFEEAKDGNEALYIKEYQLHSTAQAQKVFQELKENPHMYASQTCQSQQSVIFGYNSQKETVALAILHKQTVTIIIPTLPLNQENQDTILQFYQSEHHQ